MNTPPHDPMIGRRIEHYLILNEIGRGVNVVYRARDEDLQCDVAVKVVPARTFEDLASTPDAQKEAWALARLNHPAVVVVHRRISLPEFDCIVMEFVAGESLDEIVKRGALPEPDALRLGIDMAEGLAAAHEAGVIHRDLKPSNLRVRPDGRLKIVDFGLARHTPPNTEGPGGSYTTGTPGTLGYVAPESLKAVRPSEASDLYAAGVILYEMATGVHPFAGSSNVADATMHVPPPPPRQRNPAISAQFEAVILRCLEKDPSRRFASARELARALQAIHAPDPWRWVVRGAAVLLLVAGLVWLWNDVLRRWVQPAPSIRSLAVLPFRNASGDPQHEYLEGAVPDALISSLGEFPKLRVVTVVVYPRPAQPRPLPQIARELRVEGIVEGSVWVFPEQTLISVRLLKGPEGEVIWQGEFESKRGDLFDLKNRVARSIAHEIGLKLGMGEARVVSAAYDEYLRGRFQWNRRSDEGVRRAIEHFQRAIDLDTTFALAYTGLADAWATRGIGGMIPPTVAAPVAKRAALKALDLNPKLSEVYVSLGNIQQNFEWDWKRAERAYRKAIDLKENNAHAHHWYANHLALRGRDDRAMTEIQRAQDLDPYSLPINVGAGAFHYYARRYDEAMVEYKKAFNVDSASALVNTAMAATYIQLGREADAGRAIQRWLDHGYPGELASGAADGYRKAGLPGMLRVIIGGLEAARSAGHYVPATRIAELYALLRDRDRAIHWLNAAYEESDTQLNRLKVDPIFDPLRGDRRFAELMHKVGLAPRARCGGAPAAGR